MSTADDQGQTDGPSDPPPGNGAPNQERPGYGRQSRSPSEPPREDEVSLLDILLVLARHKTLIVRTVLAFTLIGVTYALLVPEEFTSEARVVREAQQGKGGLPGGISSGALSGLGINVGRAASGLAPSAYPEVLKSRKVRLAVVRDTFRFPDAKQPMTFVEYANRPPGMLSQVMKYTLWLPWTLKGLLGQAILGSTTPKESSEVGRKMDASEREDAAARTVAGVISASLGDTGLMTISVTADGPQLAADLTESFIDHFSTRVREIRTEKVRERLEFVKRRFGEVKQELKTAEERLAQFLDRNQNPTTATLQFRRDRLQRQVSFKEQLYSELQSQLTQTQLDLQRRQPVVTVLEKPIPPTGSSSPNRTLIVFLSIIVGGFLATSGAFVLTFLESPKGNSKRGEKIEKIREALSGDERVKSVRRRMWR